MYSKILVAVDVNKPEASVDVAAKAKKMAEHTGAELHVITVLPDDGMPMVSVALGPEHRDIMIDATKKALGEFTNTHFPGTKMHMATGSIYDRILRTATSIDADLIVIGAHRPELKDYLVGPNAAKVARHAVQSVLIVR